MKNVMISSAIAATLCWASSASAATLVSIGLQEAGVNSGNITTEATGTSSAGFVGTYGDFQVNASGVGNGNPVNLLSNAISVVGDGFAGVLNVYVTLTGVTGPLSTTQGFLSSFTQNLLSAGWTVTEMTELSSANATYAGTLLASQLFTSSNQTAMSNNTGNTGAGPLYSVTDVYTITSDGNGGTNDTIDLQATPIPGTLPLFASGLAGFWAWSRKRKVTAKLSNASFAA
jgi:hypothetical protein